MDFHTRVVAGLHIAFGLIGGFFMLIGFLAIRRIVDIEV